MSERSPRPYPVRVEGELDPKLSRALWLVKWLLAIPHYIALTFLTLVAVVLTAMALVAILVTARYPRWIFRFNRGVLRWSWRVAFYSWSVLGTDRYPPFTLKRTDYPATLEVAYPERLSRGLVLVKWWLLVLPHAAIVTFFGTGVWSLVSTPAVLAAGDRQVLTWLGLVDLIGILTLVALVALLFRARYPRGLFDLLMGLNRWGLRVFAYMALMHDEYPPFRLDQGGREPEAPSASRVAS